MSIDKSISELIATANASGEGLVSVENVTLARMRLDDMIAAATADARREGAEQMREAAADAGYAAAFGGTDVREVYNAIRALPMPTIPRQAEQPEAAEWECKAGGLKPLSQRLYDKQPDAIKKHYTRIKPAVRLKIDIAFGHHVTHKVYASRALPAVPCAVDVAHDGTESDKLRARREAVTLCAAAVGERMQGER